ncbi:SusD/RagB family nutrient-binding outer membrane lipoprotein [Pedobacter aquae]|uniref:SusD/RagB family nutrient-binding outer membrane lipoprotein n=1 Tax=Pedobacter aquae TaxID=2605747 RepID=A0A5C0VEX8_9SPHI|nr:SusD/RagB family nutrient-binding outer membrane lipoprotein [Pedobacter aquae]QEK50637.1 SusD/RagB family nutrient-binding outer membrane lipoprotein [Pedobacter aquae]
MKSNKIKILFSAIFGALFLSACEKQLDINRDPDRLTSEQVTEAGLLPSGIQYTATSFWNAGQYGNYYVHYLAGNANQAANIDSYNPYGFDNIWESAYLRAIPTLRDLISRAERNNLPHYAGIGKLLIALNLMQSTDIWGDIPYSEAFNPTVTLSPKYDSQEDIYYNTLKGLLDAAIADLSQPAPTIATSRVGTTDLVYKGDIAKWLRAAYTARGRYYLHLSKKNVANNALAVADIDRGFSDNTGASDLQLFYSTERNSPWYTALSVATPAARYARPSKYFVDLLNGNLSGVYPGLFDPRLPLLVDNGGAATYIGRPVGTQDNEQGANLANTDITVNTFYGKTTSAVPILTYTEGQFIKAEALFNTDKSAAYTAYLNGIRSSMQKFGVSTANIDLYVNNPLISKGFVALTLSDIMLQKYIALFLQLETWTDMRRYQYDTSIYRGLNKPFRNLLETQWIQRGNYPDNEPGRNPNVPKVANQAVKLWLFQ